MDQTTILMIIGAVIVAAALVFVILHMLYVTGQRSRSMLTGKLKRYAGIRSFQVLNDITLPYKGKNVHIDHILVGFFGVLVIRRVHLKGEIIVTPNDDHWTNVLDKEGLKKKRIPNPLRESEQMELALRSVFSEEGVYKISIEPIVVFTANRMLKMTGPGDLPVVKIGKLRSYLAQTRFDKDRDVDVKQVCSVILKRNVEQGK